MNTSTHRQGCHNRAPFVEKRIVQDGRCDTSLGVKIAVIDNFSYGKPCEYQHSPLGLVDKGCTGCTWRTVTSISPATDSKGKLP
ncbi:hypothetical protein [Rhodoferax ferrireducens]|uniref:hypothetical protein n=1 Tax=Rhodoferax ferrireducens TaxID=192843 RepID=UPI000E0DF18F|nr:hypothetical protein [Rhodoferax ferrireducens]